MNQLLEDDLKVVCSYKYFHESSYLNIRKVKYF